MFKFSRQYHIALIAPASSCPEETVTAGKAVLEKSGCQVTLMPHVFRTAALKHLAASDEERAADINAAIDDNEIDIIWAVRGGSGTLRILDKINWRKLKESGKLFAGFSDITAIHWAMAKYGAEGILAAPTMSLLASAEDPETITNLPDAIEAKNAALQLPSLRGGKICGQPLPGNIAVASSLCGTPYFPDTSGKIVVLEEVGEAPYRLDRMLTQLRLAGTFDKCAGVVFGHFTGCGEKEDIRQLLQDFTDKVNCPVFYDFHHGHELPFHSLNGRQTLTVSPC